MTVRSKAPGDKHDGGYERPFTVVPERSLERVQRDVTATFVNLPMWGVAEFFERVREELGRPDMGRVTVSLEAEFRNLTEDEYSKLASLRDKYWMGIELEVNKTRLYPPPQHSRD